MIKENGLYRTKAGHGVNDRNYRENDKVKFVKYLGMSRMGHDRIKYELVNFKGEVIAKGNHFKKDDLDLTARYIIKR